MGCLIDHLHLYVSEIQNKCGFVYEVMFWTVYFSVSIVKKTKKKCLKENGAIHQPHMTHQL